MYGRLDAGGQRAAYEAKRPPPAEQLRPAAPPPEGRDRPLHLVLLNGAEGRTGALIGVAADLARRGGRSSAPPTSTRPHPPGTWTACGCWRLPGAGRWPTPAAGSCGRPGT